MGNCNNDELTTSWAGPSTNARYARYSISQSASTSHAYLRDQGFECLVARVDSGAPVFCVLFECLEDKMSDSDGENALERGRSRKRSHNDNQWKTNEAKKKRNMGQQYVSRHSNIIVPARKIGEKCKCGCFEKIGEEKVKEIFKAFWDIGDFNQQNEYISKLVKSEDVKRSRVKDRPPRTLRRITYSVTLYSCVGKHFTAYMASPNAVFALQ